MAKVRFTIECNLPAATVLAVATNFSAIRPRYWPNIDPKVYRVHSTSATSAEVTEGSAMFGGIWARIIRITDEKVRLGISGDVKGT